MRKHDTPASVARRGFYRLSIEVEKLVTLAMRPGGEGSLLSQRLISWISVDEFGVLVGGIAPVSCECSR